MAKKAYVGVNDVARNCKKIYVGVNGVARKVVKGYIGVNGVARQFYSAREGYELDKDYQVGQSYTLVKADIETFLRDVFKAFINFNSTYASGSAAFANFKNNQEAIISNILSRKSDYESIAIGLSFGYSGYNLTLVELSVNMGNSNNSYQVTSKNTAYGYDYCEVSPTIPGPPYSGISFSIRVWENSIDYGTNQSGGYYNQNIIGYNLLLSQAHITYGVVKATNNGIKY